MPNRREVGLSLVVTLYGVYVLVFSFRIFIFFCVFYRTTSLCAQGRGAGMMW